jgi:HEAT repeat protein
MAALSLAGYPTAEAVPPLVKLSKSWNEAARRNATWALGFVKDKRAVKALIERLSDKDIDVRREAALGLKRLSDPASVPELIKALFHDENAGVRFDAARALGDIEDPRVVYPLINALKNDPDWGVRGICACALGHTKDAKAVEALGAMLVADAFCSEACWTHEMAAWALAKIRDKEECTRRRASWALIRIGQPAAPAATSALRDPNHLVRERAALILGWIEDDTALYPLLRAIEDDEPMVRQAAAWALGRLGDPRATGALKVAANEKDNHLKESAREAVERLTLD